MKKFVLFLNFFLKFAFFLENNQKSSCFYFSFLLFSLKKGSYFLLFLINYKPKFLVSSIIMGFRGKRFKKRGLWKIPKTSLAYGLKWKKDEIIFILFLRMVLKNRITSYRPFHPCRPYQEQLEHFLLVDQLLQLLL